MKHALHHRYGHAALITSTDSRKAERMVRSAAASLLGRGRKDVFYEHGQWWVRIWDRSEDRDITYSAVDTNTGISFERID